VTRIFIACPKPDTPSGGVYALYKMAEILNGLGHTTRIVQEKLFDPYWFANKPDQELASNEPTEAGEGDIVIIPEVRWPQPPRISMLPGVRKVMFLQNFIWLDRSIYLQNPGEVIVCSRFLWNHARRELNANVIGKFTPFLEEGIWRLTPKTKDRVLVFGRRNDYHKKLVPVLEQKGYIVDYVTESLSQRDIAQKLESCEFYVHLVHPEGFPMACLEAMRSGTIVVGTTGGGGNEFMHHRETAYVVQDPENGHYGSDDEFISRIMEGFSELSSNADLRSLLWTQAFAWSKRYTIEESRAELKEIFG